MPDTAHHHGGMGCDKRVGHGWKYPSGGRGFGSSLGRDVLSGFPHRRLVLWEADVGVGCVMARSRSGGSTFSFFALKCKPLFAPTERSKVIPRGKRESEELEGGG